MPITPYSTPIATEYKPLGLEAFAQPLSQMQEKFDITKQAVEDAEFEINRLDKDDPRSAELVKTLETKRDELAQNLLTTKNYRQAAQKLSSLNKMYTKDPELQAIKSNYDTFKKADEEQKKRIDGKTFTQRDYDEWKYRAINEFKGTGYDKSTDSYSSINVHARGNNMEDQMREEALKLAGMAKEQGIESIAGMVQLDPFTKQQLTKKLTYISKEQLSEEIKNFLGTSDKYQDWVKEKADYEWYYNRHSAGGKGQEFNQRVIEGHVNNLDKKIELYSQYMNSANVKPDERKEYESTLKSLQAQKQDTLNKYEKGFQTGNLDDLSKELYTLNAQTKFETLGYTAADIVDFTKQDIGTKEITDDFAKGRAAENVKKLNAQKPLTTNITNAGGATIISGVGTSATEDQKQVNFNQNTLEQIKAVNPDDVDFLKGVEPVIKTPENISAFNTAKESVKDVYVIGGRLQNYQKEGADMEVKIKTLMQDVYKGTPEERELKRVELKKLIEDKAEMNSAYLGEKVPLEKLIEMKVSENSDAKSLWESEAVNKNVEKFLAAIQKEGTDYLHRETKSAQVFKLNGEQNLKRWYAENPDKSLTPEQEELIKGSFSLPVVNMGGTEQISNVTKLEQELSLYDATNPVNPLSPEKDLVRERMVSDLEKARVQEKENPTVKSTQAEGTTFKDPSSSLVSFTKDLTNSYRYALSANVKVAAPEVFLDETASLATDGASDRLKEWNLNNMGGASALKRVHFDNKTGRTGDNMTEKTSFDVGAYEEIAHYAGVNQNGETILRYNLKKEYQDEGSIKSLAASSIRKKNPGKYGSDEAIPQSEIDAWKRSNPQNLYAVPSGVSINLGKEAELNYTELATTAMQVNDFKGYQTNLQNYATMHMISNPERREAYLEMGAMLDSAVKNGKKTTTIFQAPAAWQEQPDGSSKGYQLEYKIEEGQIIATVSEVIARGGQEPKYTNIGRKVIDSTGNLPVQLATMDLTFGTGREEDVVEHNVNWGQREVFVPAFQQVPQFFMGGN